MNPSDLLEYGPGFAPNLYELQLNNNAARDISVKITPTFGDGTWEIDPISHVREPLNPTDSIFSLGSFKANHNDNDKLVVAVEFRIEFSDIYENEYTQNCYFDTLV